MVCGEFVFRGNGHDVGCQKSQLSLFTHRHDMIQVGRSSYWLRDVFNAANFSFIDYRGNASITDSSSELGVRPFALIG